MRHVTDDHITHQHLVQRVSVFIQKGNTAAVLGGMEGGSGDQFVLNRFVFVFC